MSDPGAAASVITRAERLLPWACLLSAGVLFASELMTTFEFTPPGAEPLCSQSASDRHGNAMALIAVFAAAATLVAILAASKPAALATCVAGVAALLVFLLADLPDASAVGTIGDSCGVVRQSFFDAEAVPQAGFWLEMIGALGLAISGVALATLSPDQLRGLRPGRWGRGTEPAPAPVQNPTVADAQPASLTNPSGANDSGDEKNQGVSKAAKSEPG
jgi:hypothetical protein